LDVGPENQECYLLEFFNDNKKKQQNDHAHAAFAEPLAEAHALSPDSGQQVIGERHRFLGGSVKPLLLFIENRRSEAREPLIACFALISG
jgi:hypothetical protein